MAVQAAIPTAARYAPSAWGASHPIGAQLTPDGLNLSVYTKRASGIEVLLFDAAEDDAPTRIELDRTLNRTGPYWHAFLPGVRAGQLYGLRAHGPFAPEQGLRFDPAKALLDPYGLAVAVPDGYDRGAASRPGDNAATAMKSVVAGPDRYDWEGDTPLQRPFSETVIYEMHVRGFTRHPSSGVAASKRGTYAGLVEKIPYLRDLGITHAYSSPYLKARPGSTHGYDIVDHGCLNP